MRLLFRWLTREKLELLYIGGCEVLPEPLNASTAAITPAILLSVLVLQ